MPGFQVRGIDPKAVAAALSAYHDVMAEIVQGTGYLPPPWFRKAIAEEIIATVDAGEGHLDRLKESGLSALRESNVVPLSLSLAFRLRPPHHQDLLRQAQADTNHVLPCDV